MLKLRFIHFFVSSCRILATCIYLSFKLKFGEFKIELVTGKCKILDANKNTIIPRGELNRVVLMSEVYVEVAHCLKDGVVLMSEVYVEVAHCLKDGLC